MSFEPHAPECPSPAHAAAPQRPGLALARFAAARGLPVLDAGGVLWARTDRAMFRSLPQEACVDPDLDDVRRALRSVRGLGAVYPTVTRPGWPLGLHAAFPARYSIQSVEPNHRRQVRKGTEASEIRHLDPDELFALGHELNLETMARQRRYDPEFGDLARWRRMMDAARDCPGVGLSGAFVGGKLAAFWIWCRDGSWLHLLYKMSRTEHLIHRAGVALDFWMITRAAPDLGAEAVSNSFLTVFRAGESLDRYKRAMGFETIPHRRAVVFHPALHPVLVSPVGRAAAEVATRLRPASTRLEGLSKLLRGARRAT
jgi:hypothetical protein